MRRCWSLVSIVAMAWCTPTQAVELQVEASALEKLLRTQVFRDNGRWNLAKPERCNHPYLETPSAHIENGRIRLKARFAGRVGSEVAGLCVSVGEPSWLTVSGRPAVEGHTLMLSDVRIEHVEKPLVAGIAEKLIGPALKEGLRVNLEEAIQELLAPKNTVPYVLKLATMQFALPEQPRASLRILVDFTMAIR